MCISNNGLDSILNRFYIFKIAILLSDNLVDFESATAHTQIVVNN